MKPMYWMLTLIAAMGMVIALIIPAFALDFSAPITNLDGKPETICTAYDEKNPRACIDEKPLTLGRVVATILLQRSEADKTADVLELARRGDLARQIWSGKAPVDLTAEDIVLIKSLLGKSGFSPLVVSQVLSALDPSVKGKSSPPQPE